MRRYETLSSTLQIMGDKATQAAKKALREGADMVVNDARSRCPVATGKLRESIHKEVKRGGTYIKVVADAEKDGFFYGRVVEFSPKINKPFLYPAMDAARNSIRESVTNAVRESLKRK